MHVCMCIYIYIHIYVYIYRERERDVRAPAPRRSETLLCCCLCWVYRLLNHRLVYVVVFVCSCIMYSNQLAYLFSESSNTQLISVHCLTQCVVTVAVVTVCRSYESFYPLAQLSFRPAMRPFRRSRRIVQVLKPISRPWTRTLKC